MNAPVGKRRAPGKAPVGVTCAHVRVLKLSTHMSDCQVWPYCKQPGAGHGAEWVGRARAARLDSTHDVAAVDEELVRQNARCVARARRGERPDCLKLMPARRGWVRLDPIGAPQTDGRGAVEPDVVVVSIRLLVGHVMVEAPKHDQVVPMDIPGEHVAGGR